VQAEQGASLTLHLEAFSSGKTRERSPVSRVPIPKAVSLKVGRARSVAHVLLIATRTNVLLSCRDRLHQQKRAIVDPPRAVSDYHQRRGGLTASGGCSPKGNPAGGTSGGSELGAKRLELLRDLVRVRSL
jgi:hypothetical protein